MRRSPIGQSQDPLPGLVGILRDILNSGGSRCGQKRFKNFILPLNASCKAATTSVRVPKRFSHCRNSVKGWPRSSTSCLPAMGFVFSGAGCFSAKPERSGNDSLWCGDAFRLCEKPERSGSCPWPCPRYRRKFQRSQHPDLSNRRASELSH